MEDHWAVKIISLCYLQIQVLFWKFSCGLQLLSHIFYFFWMQSWNVISVIAKQFEIKLLNSNYYISVFVFSYWQYCLSGCGLSLSLGVGFLISLTNSISLHYSALGNADLKRRAALWQRSLVYFWSVTQNVCETLDKSYLFLSLDLLEEIERHYYSISIMIFPFHL